MCFWVFFGYFSGCVIWAYFGCFGVFLGLIGILCYITEGNWGTLGNFGVFLGFVCAIGEI